MNLIEYKETERFLTLDEETFKQLEIAVAARKKVDEYHFNKAYSKLSYMIIILLMLLHAVAGIIILVVAIGKV